jgi:curved DNA-binding protein CbpA
MSSSVDAARKLLGVTPAATGSDVRRAFRAQVRHVHPDLGGDPVRFRLLWAAYTVARDNAAPERPSASALPAPYRWTVEDLAPMNAPLRGVVPVGAVASAGTHAFAQVLADALAERGVA